MKNNLDHKKDKKSLLYRRNFPLYEINLEDIKIEKNFSLHENLNDKVWDDFNLKPEVKHLLLKIAYEFVDYLKIPIPVEDITLTGSLANFNYTKNSDFDLHIITDFSKINEDEELLENYFRTKSLMWEIKNKIEIKGYPLQLYVQNEKNKHHSTGVYSLKNDEWLIKPEKINFKIDFETTKNKIKKVIDKIEVLEKYKTSPEMLYIYAKDLKDKIMQMRKSGLEKEGEYSPENLAFKYLRNEKYIEKLKNLVDSSFSEMYTLK